MLTKTPPSFEVLDIFQFSGDYEAHDDELQERLACNFDNAFEDALNELRNRFGEPATLDGPPSDLPMNSFRSAVWHKDDKAISLVASHEDRECPYMLLLSITSRKTT